MFHKGFLPWKETPFSSIRNAIRLLSDWIRCLTASSRLRFDLCLVVLRRHLNPAKKKNDEKHKLGLRFIQWIFFAGDHPLTWLTSAPRERPKRVAGNDLAIKSLRGVFFIRASAALAAFLLDRFLSCTWKKVFRSAGPLCGATTMLSTRWAHCTRRYFILFVFWSGKLLTDYPPIALLFCVANLNNTHVKRDKWNAHNGAANCPIALHQRQDFV